MLIPTEPGKLVRACSLRDWIEAQNLSSAHTPSRHWGRPASGERLSNYNRDEPVSTGPRERPQGRRCAGLRRPAIFVQLVNNLVSTATATKGHLFFRVVYISRNQTTVSELGLTVDDVMIQVH